MSIRDLVNLGTQNLAYTETSRAKSINLIALFTFGISLLYSLNYIFILNNLGVAVINMLFTLAYLFGLTFSYFQQFRKAKTWFFCVLMLHLVVCTNIYVTKDSGFHLYFFLVPTGAFLLFNYNEIKIKAALSLAATCLFFYCENTINTNPLITLTAEQNHMLYQSVIFINMIEVIVVMTIFSTQIDKNELKLTLQAKTDMLTGVANRRYFFEQGHLMLNQSLTNQRPFCLTLLDIDHFKKINDIHGHQAGDACLRQLSQLIGDNIREQDFFARIGGEEFVIILPETTLQEANSQIERLRILIEQTPIKVNYNEDIRCTASFGVAGVDKNNSSLKEILVSADHALYQAKHNGRNRISIFSANAA